MVTYDHKNIVKLLFKLIVEHNAIKNTQIIKQTYIALNLKCLEKRDSKGDLELTPNLILMQFSNFQIILCFSFYSF